MKNLHWKPDDGIWESKELLHKFSVGLQVELTVC